MTMNIGGMECSAYKVAIILISIFQVMVFYVTYVPRLFSILNHHELIQKYIQQLYRAYSPSLRFFISSIITNFAKIFEAATTGAVHLYNTNLNDGNWLFLIQLSS